MRTGCDLVKINRLREAAQRHPRLLERIFSSEELDYCMSKSDPWPSLAARFAAKEALIKVLPAGTPVIWKDIYLLNELKGRPVFKLGSSTEEALKASGIKAWDVSLSHEADYAMATVVAWGG